MPGDLLWGNAIINSWGPKAQRFSSFFNWIRFSFQKIQLSCISCNNCQWINLNAREL